MTTTEIDQLGEFLDACRGEITGAFLVVELPDGTRQRVTAVRFEGAPGVNRSAILTTDPERWCPGQDPDDDRLRHHLIYEHRHVAAADAREEAHRLLHERYGDADHLEPTRDSG